MLLRWYKIVMDTDYKGEWEIIVDSVYDVDDGIV